MNCFISFQLTVSGSEVMEKFGIEPGIELVK
jgi:hypothetical protein